MPTSRRIAAARIGVVVLFAVELFIAFHRSAPAETDPTVPEAVAHKPGAIPDRVILTWSGDPATTQSVTWRTDASVRNPVAQIAMAEDGPAFKKKARQVAAQSEGLQSDLGAAQYHSVRFTGLEPASTYVYRVGDGFNWSEWNQFRTAAVGPAPLEFVYVGDAQNDIFEMWSRVIRQAYTEAPKMRFIVHAGDLINRANRDAEWGGWHQAAGWINRSISSLPTPGNHEYEQKKLTRHWRPQFTLPENGPQGLEETCYFIDIQGVRLISLNSNELQAEQAAWLSGVLAKNPNQWTILTFHHPVYSAARSRDNKELRERWQPIFDQYGVDLVLTGHDHTYARSNLVDGRSMRSGKKGTVYVVSVSGPKMYQLDREDWMDRAAQGVQLFQIVRVQGDRLMYEARTARGLLYDAFELRKGKAGVNELVNLTPKSPETQDQLEGK